jgi:hypothetical protein
VVGASSGLVATPKCSVNGMIDPKMSTSYAQPFISHLIYSAAEEDGNLLAGFALFLRRKARAPCRYLSLSAVCRFTKSGRNSPNGRGEA